MDVLSLDLGSATKALLVWSTEEAGESYSDNGQNTLVLANYAPNIWQPYKKVDTTEAKIEAKKLYPRFVSLYVGQPRFHPPSRLLHVPVLTPPVVVGSCVVVRVCTT